MSKHYKSLLVACSAIGVGLYLAGSALLKPEIALAQQSILSPDEIPLNVSQIFQSLEPEAGYGRVTQNIIRELIRNHYSEIIFDDEFSGNLLDSYIKTLDGSRVYFTEADIQEFEQYRENLDDLLQAGSVEAGYLIFNRYQQRLIERLVYSIRRIEENTIAFDFTIDEFIIVDREETPWATSTAELEDLWRKRVKSNYLNMKLVDEDTDEEIREDLSERFRGQLSRVLKVNSLDVFQRYMDAMTMTFDPHTQYYAPRAAENFNMSMRLSLEGIGAVLVTKGEYTEVVSIVSGGPADLAGELQAADRITAVAQDNNDFVDVVGWRVDDVVQLIRGEKGSIVRLNVIPDSADNDTMTRVIKITRDTVKLEESSAKKEIVEIEHEGETFRIGVIDLPTFYIDFEALQNRDPNYRSSTNDVRNLIEELKVEGIDAIVMDLRNNGGGSLSEANALVGLFITRGATVQVRDSEGNNIVQGDNDPSVTYDGPMAVLVNKLSASASEIFAGAIQDYQRGLVLGGQTFGKGTVQGLIPLGEGQMKITSAKFYRISGESTQHRGVTPDINFPDLYDTSDTIGESMLPSALPWDTIRRSNNYRTYGDYSIVLPGLIGRHEQRLAVDPDFNLINAQIERTLENLDRNQLSLNEMALIEERDENDAWRLEVNNIRRIAKDQEPYASLDELDGIEEDDLSNNEIPAQDPLDSPNTRILTREGFNLESPSDPDSQTNSEEIEAEDEDAEPDPYLVESGKILLDLINLRASDALTLAIKK